jgi:hypothetical protein
VSVTIFDAASSIGNPLKGEKSVNGDLHVKMPPPGNVSWMNRSAENWIAERERERERESEGERDRKKERERERRHLPPIATKTGVDGATSCKRRTQWLKIGLFPFSPNIER